MLTLEEVIVDRLKLKGSLEALAWPLGVSDEIDQEFGSRAQHLDLRILVAKDRYRRVRNLTPVMHLYYIGSVQAAVTCTPSWPIFLC